MRFRGKIDFRNLASGNMRHTWSSAYCSLCQHGAARDLAAWGEESFWPSECSVSKEAWTKQWEVWRLRQKVNLPGASETSRTAPPPPPQPIAPTMSRDWPSQVPPPPPVTARTAPPEPPPPPPRGPNTASQMPQLPGAATTPPLATFKEESPALRPGSPCRLLSAPVVGEDLLAQRILAIVKQLEDPICRASSFRIDVSLIGSRASLLCDASSDVDILCCFRGGAHVGKERQDVSLHIAFGMLGKMLLDVCPSNQLQSVTLQWGKSTLQCMCHNTHVDVGFDWCWSDLHSHEVVAIALRKSVERHREVCPLRIWLQFLSAARDGGVVQERERARGQKLKSVVLAVLFAAYLDGCDIQHVLPEQAFGVHLTGFWNFCGRMSTTNLHYYCERDREFRFEYVAKSKPSDVLSVVNMLGKDKWHGKNAAANAAGKVGVHSLTTWLRTLYPTSSSWLRCALAEKAAAAGRQA